MDVRIKYGLTIRNHQRANATDANYPLCPTHDQISPQANSPLCLHIIEKFCSNLDILPAFPEYTRLCPFAHPVVIKADRVSFPYNFIKTTIRINETAFPHLIFRIYLAVASTETFW